MILNLTKEEKDRIRLVCLKFNAQMVIIDGMRINPPKPSKQENVNAKIFDQVPNLRGEIHTLHNG